MGEYVEEVATAMSTNDFWAASMADLETCHFPRLADGAGITNKREKIAVKLPYTSEFDSILRQFCVKNACTVQTAIKMAWGVLLGRYIGSESVAFTTTTLHSGNSKSSLCQMNLQPEKSLSQLLKEIEADYLRTAPFHAEKLDDVLGLRESMVNTHIFFRKDGGDDNFSEFGAVSEESMKLLIDTSASHTIIGLDYSLSKISATQAESISATFSQILAILIENSVESLADVDALSSNDMDQIWSWNCSGPAAIEECVHNLIHQKAAKSPHATAVFASDATFTYKELDDFSTRLAYHLVDLGVGPEIIVPLCFEKSAWTIVAMIGVIKAGGALLFLDPKNPTSRNQEIVSKVNAKVMITSRMYSEMGTLYGKGMSSVIVDESFIGQLKQHATMPAVSVKPSNILYVIFTSGSTGTPKGCVIEHRSFLTGALRQAAVSNMRSSSRVGQLAAYTFDVSILEQLTALLAGACICVPGEEARAKGLLSMMNDFQINWCFLTPSLAKMIKPADVPHLKVLVLGGEALTKEDVETWASHLQLANGYGPSECSVAATANARLTPTTDPANIGHALGGVCWIADAKDTNKLVPIGAPGELLIQGPLLARGYLAEPEKTKERFINDPKWLLDRDNGLPRRFYRTGDLVRYNSDGTIHFIGRADDQVKLRGLRIELGEIEHHLAKVEHVRHSAVVLPKSGLCKERIVALMSLRTISQELASTGIQLVDQSYNKLVQEAISNAQSSLSKSVPPYMVPTVWIVLNDLPLSSSAKIDRTRVKKWVLEMDEETYTQIIGLDNQGSSSIPTSELEKQLQEACSQIMNVPTHYIPLNKSFQGVGGDSILAMKLMARLRSEGFELSIKDIILSSTLSELALCMTPATDSSMEAIESNIPPMASMISQDQLRVLGVQSLDELEDVYPVSSTQQGILLSQHKKAGTYEFQIICEVVPSHTEPADIKRLQKSWQQVVDRHATLRTIFINNHSSGDYSQVVLKNYLANVSVVTSQSEDDVYAVVNDNIAINYEEPRPSHQMVICTSASGKTYCALSISHALIDGMSVMVLFRDLSQAYGGAFTTTTKPLYRDYISYLATRSSDNDLAYWKKYLDDLVPQHFPVLNDGHQTPNELHEIDLDFEQSSELYDFCAKNNVTTSSVFQVAWSLVLQAYTQSKDICFGYLTSGRDAPVAAIDDMVGLFVNMLVCRLDLAQETTLLQLASKSQMDFLNALAHQHASLAQIQHSLPSFGRALFNTSMTVQTSIEDEGQSSALGFKPFRETDPTEYSITVNVTSSKQFAKANLRYWTGQISDGHAANIAASFKDALLAVLRRPESSPSSVTLFTERDEAQIMNWNSEVLVPVENLVHNMFKRHVVERPNDSAICAWDFESELTYAELDRLSTKLAVHLSKNFGVRREVFVPTCFDKSGWTVVAMLAIIKAGGANVGVDPTHPEERRRAILEDTQAKVVLVAPKHAAKFPGVENIIVVERSLFDELAPADESDLKHVNVKISDPAMMVYTSGSTGRAKGIIIEHRNFCSGVSAWAPWIKLGPGSRMFNFCAHSFDTCNADLFGTIMFGGCVCIPSEHDRLNDIPGAINRLNANSAWLTPSVACTFLPEDVPGFKNMILCGEQIKQENIDVWAHKVHLVNGYGPAECSINSTCLLYDSKTLLGNIGVGVGTKTWIAEKDNHDQLCCIGSIGELLIEGPLVAREYINNPEKTAAVFITNPKWAKEEKSGVARRFYKTGDLVRYNSDGTVNYLGRADGQIKINGQRTELSEIEHHLSMAQGIERGVVLYPKDGPCAKRLVGVLSIEGHSMTREESPEARMLSKEEAAKAASQLQSIRNYLTEKVPPFMVPKIWVPVTRVPLTTSAKLDRLSLMKMLVTMSDEVFRELMSDQGSLEPPSTETEKQLQLILSNVLNIQPNEIGMNSSFLGLGGDSITAMQLVTKCHSEGILLTVKDILQSKTIANIASSAKAKGSQKIFKAESFGTLFDLSPVQKLYMETQFSSPENQSEHYNQSFLLRLKQDVDASALTSALSIVASRHSMLRARFTKSNGSWGQIVQKESSEQPFEVYSSVTRESMLALIEKAQSSLNIEKGPVFKGLVFELTGDATMLFLVAHHLVIDLVSWRIIFQDLEDTLKGRLSAFQDGLSFQTWLELQQQHAQAQIFDNQLLSANTPDFKEFWGMTEKPNIFEDAVEKKVYLDEKTTSAIFGSSNDALRTEPVEIILAALQYSFNQTFSNRSVPIIYSEGHGREPWDPEINLAKTVGWFTTYSGQHLALKKEEMKLLSILRETKDSRRRIEDNGRPYFAAQFLHPQKSQSNPFSNMEVVFNFLGKFQSLEREDALFQLEPLKDDEKIVNQGGKVPRAGLFEIYAVMFNNKLELSFTYNKQMQHTEQIQSWINGSKNALTQLVEELSSIDLQFTLSDFPLLPISSQSLETLGEKIQELQIRPRDIEDIYPAAPIQEGILISQAQMPETYRIEMTCEVLPQGKSKKVDVNRLRQAWQKVVDRHPLLRTVFVDSLRTNALFDQVVLKYFTANTEVIRADDPLQSFREQGQMAWDNKSPVHRVTISEANSGKGVFMRLEINHTLIDGSSMPLLIRDLTLAYEGKLEPGSGPLYSDYVAYLQQSSESSVQFWKEHLAGIEPCHFPVTRPKKHELASNTLSSIDIEVEKVAELHQYCVENNVTMANVFQTAWALVIRAYSGVDKVNFGYLSSGRDIDVKDINDALGPFITMLVCHLDVSNELTGKEAVEKLQNDYLSSLPHQHCSLAQIQHALNVPSGQPLFNTVMSLQRPLSDESGEEHEIGFRDTGSLDPTEYDISLNITATSKKIEVYLSYWTAKTSEDEAKNIASTFTAAIYSLLQNSSSKLHDLDLFSQRNHDQVWAWNNGAVPPDAVEACIHDSFEEMALQQPDAPALCAWDGEMTYRQLSEITTRLATHLISLGVTTESPVHTIFDKSMWTIVAMIAVWKAGGSCAPHDPSHPIERLRTNVETTGAKILLGGKSHEEMMRSIMPNVVVVSELLNETLPPFAGSIARQATPNNAAFICFTSGSTGKPKGVVVEHRNFSTLVKHWGPECGFDKTTRAFQFCSYTFDTSNAEMYITLTRGGCVCIPNDYERLHDLAGAINRLQANWLFLTPTVATLVHPHEVPLVKTLVLGGEAARPDNVLQWGSHVRLINSYGPCETTPWSSRSFLTPGTVAANIGRGDGALMWVTDPTNPQLLTPVGCIGELLTDGALVSRGYLKDPVKTAAAFIENPVWLKNDIEKSGGGVRRIYRTGDLVKYNPDGTLLFSGRVNESQVKLHGQRIELGEIEHQISTHPMVSHAVVFLPKSGECKDRLTAVVDLVDFMTGVNGKGVILPLKDQETKLRAMQQITQIRLEIADHLPPHMIPTCWLVIEDAPMTTSKKIDRGGLRKWVLEIDEETFQKTADLGEDVAEEGESNETEELLRSVISRVLNLPIDKVARSKSFLNLGGDSISAMQVITACRQHKISLPIKAILRSKTISEMATTVVDLRQSTLSTDEDYETAFELSPMQKMWFDEVAENVAPAPGQQYNQSFLLKLGKQVSTASIRTSLEAVAERHSMLRARFAKSNSGNWSQQILREVANSYRFQSHQIQESESAAVIAAAQASIDIQNGPVFGADLINLESGEQLLFLAAHHLVVDLVSWRIIIKDIEDVLTSGVLSATEKPLPFQTWSRLQSKYAEEQLQPSKCLPYSIPEADYAYWGMKNRSNKQGDTIDLGFTLDKDTTSALLLDSHSAFGTEPLDVFLSALFQSFGNTFGRTTPTIFTEGHGREPWDSEVDVASTVGWFTTMAPISIKLPQGADVLQSTKLTKDNRKMLPGNGWPYFTSRYLNHEGVKAYGNHWPIEITFNYLGLYQQLEKKEGLLQLVAQDNVDVGSTVNRMTLFDIYAVVIDGGLRFSFNFNKFMDRQPEIRQWVDACKQSLTEHAQKLSSHASEPTLSDFTISSMTYPELDNFKANKLASLGLKSLNEVEDIFNCSPLQEGILLSQRILTGAYEVLDIFEVRSSNGPIDRSRLEAAWQRVVDYHPSLRTIFIENICQDTTFGQVVVKKCAANILNVPCIDGNALTALDSLPAIDYKDETRPHHRLAISQTATQVFCKLEISHSLVDGTSMAILVRDFGLAYEGKLSGNGPQYSDYISYLQSKPTEEATDFWVKYLAETKPCQFPTLTDGTISTSTERRFVDVELPSATDLYKFCQEHDVTLANFLKAAWALTLGAYTGTEQVCFGYLVSGRDVPVPRIEDAIGPFINMLICSANIEELKKESVASVVEKMQEEYFQSLPHQHASLARIQNALKLSEMSLFNTVLSFQAAAANDLNESEVSFIGIKGDDPSEYDISVKVLAGRDEVKIMLKHLTSVVNSEQARHLASAFSSIISNMLARPTSKMAEISTFSKQNQEIIRSWNSERQYPLVNKCVHDIIQDHAAKQPNAEAIVSYDRSYTYKELDEITNILANHLRTLNVGPEVFVPICMQKSSWAIVSMIAAMKAGGSFVPLDPAHPENRLADILGDCQAQLVLVTPETAAKFANSSMKVVVVSTETISKLPQLTSKCDSGVTPANMVYTLFTSGSTGKPKGVVLEHAAVSSSCIYHGGEFGFTNSSRVFQFSAYTFDAMVMEIFTTLLYGGCVCVPSEAERMGNFGKAMAKMNVNLSYLTASVTRLLKPEDVPMLKTLVTGGEKVGQDVVEKWVNRVRFIGSYGPTENCFTCTHGTYEGPESAANSIGKAVGSFAWVVEPRNHNKLAAIGAIGELLMSGPILYRGYLNMPEKTAQAMIQDPEWFTEDIKTSIYSTPGQPTFFYKTGDLVRYNSDGTIMFLGRKDQQVKLRGLRIELGEIEFHVKSKLQGAHNVAVEIVAPEAAQRKQHLAAFFSMDETVSRAAGSQRVLPISGQSMQTLLDLQTSLADALPSYMIPSMYIPVNFIPITSSTKVDRTELHRMVTHLTEEDFNMYSLSTGVKEAPSTNMEKDLAALWSEILDVQTERIGVNDSFFRLGGDSIMAMRLASQAFDKNIDLVIANIFSHPTLSDMATVAEYMSGAPASLPELEPFQLLGDAWNVEDLTEKIAAQYEINKDTIEDIYRTSALQEGMMALAERQQNAYLFQRVFRLPSSVDTELLQEAWQLVTDNNPILRTRIVNIDSESLQVIVQDELDWRSADSLDAYVASDLKEPFKYGDRLIRFCIVSEGAERYFVFTANHTVYDGVSLPLIFEQVQQAYNFETPEDAPAYNHFINYLQNLDSAAAETFWKAQFAGGRPVAYPQLPAKHELHVDQAMIHSVEVSRKPGSDITMSTILRAAWALVVGQYSESQDVVFGATLSGRNAPVAGIAKMVGPTITTVPVRVQIAANQSISSFLKAVQQQSTEMIPFEQTGLQNIARMGADIKDAIDFRNLIVIQPSAGQSDNDFLGAEIVDFPVVDFDTYPLIVECGLRDSGFDIQARYDNGVVSAWKLERVLHLFGHIVRQLSEPAAIKTIGDIDMLSPEDVSQIMEWNSNTLKAKETSVPEVFAKQVKLHPKAQAVCAWDGELTYEELDKLSDRLAYYLVLLGVGPEKLVPLCFDKSVFAVVTMLSVMKAGGACVNLGHSLPINRLAGIVEDSGANFILAAPQHEHLFSTFEQHTVVIDPAFIENLPKGCAKQLLPKISPKNPAFVLFTSGSTGRSKGIVVEHGSLCTSSEAHGSTWKIESGTRVFQFANYIFDVSVADIFTTLQRGGCICVPSEEERVTDITGAIRKYNANWCFLTPSVAILLDPKSAPNLKTLVFGGEAPTKEVIEKWAPHLDLILCYGPSETSIYCSGNKPAQKDSDPASLGLPIGCHFWVADVNDHNRLVPIGCVGELLLEGRIVSRGYLNEPEKTAAAFVTPAWLPKGSPNTTLYKTGDLVKYNADGSVNFVARKDTQTKIRGLRVELGEIEFNINAKFPGLKRVTVDVGIYHDRQELTAFFSFENQDNSDNNSNIKLSMTKELMAKMFQLEKDLSDALPSYMVPMLYIPLQQIPLTLNGKADRNQLRQIVANLSQEEFSSYSLAEMGNQAPVNAMELELQKMWATTLNIDAAQISTSGNFFRLGGDSIIAMKLVSLARANNISLAVSDVFKYPTLSAMAAAVQEAAPTANAQRETYEPFSLMEDFQTDSAIREHICSQINFTQENVIDVLPATDFQSHCMAHALLKTRGLLNYWTFDGTGPVDRASLERRCFQVVQENEILRTVFALHRNQFLQVVLKHLLPEVEVYQTTEDVIEFSKEICQEDTNQKFNFGESYVKFYLIENKEKAQHRLIMRMSHAQYDGVCLPQLWETFTGSQTAPVAQIPFSQYLNEVQSLKTPEAYQYWRDLLKDSSMTNVVAHSGPSYAHKYDTRINQTFKNIPISVPGITFATVLKAAWGLVLAQEGVTSDVVFGHVISGRNVSLPDVENIVGPAVNIIPVRVAFQKGWTVIDALQHVQDQQLNTMPYETLGFRDITRNCTQWPNYTRFSSVVQHQNITTDKAITMNGTAYDVSAICPMADESDVAIQSNPRGEDMEVVLMCSSLALTPEFSKELLNKLCITIQKMLKDVNRPIPVPDAMSWNTPRIPVTPAQVAVKNNKLTLSRVWEEEKYAQAALKVERCWRQVLDLKRSVKMTRESSFYELGGDFVAIAQLAVLLGREGLIVGVEELIDCHAFGSQVALLLAA